MRGLSLSGATVLGAVIASTLTVSAQNTPSGDGVVGGWTTASRERSRTLNTGPNLERPADEGTDFIQLYRFGNPFIVVGGSIGGNFSVNRVGLDPFNQYLSRTPGLAGGVHVEAFWPQVLGENTHFATGVEAIYGGTVNSQLRNRFLPGSLNTSGPSDYAGGLAYLAVERPIAPRFKVRLKAGVGAARRRVRLRNAGTLIARGEGTVLLVRGGVGLFTPLSDRVDVGLEVLTTYAGGIDGVAGVTPFKLRSSVDTAVMVSFRIFPQGRQVGRRGLLINSRNVISSNRLDHSLLTRKKLRPKLRRRPKLRTRPAPRNLNR